MEEADKTQTEQQTQEGTEPTETPSPVEEANKAAERLELANKEHKALLERGEKLRAEQILGGTTQAGQQPPELKEETPKEYADRIMSGELRGEEGKHD